MKWSSESNDQRVIQIVSSSSSHSSKENIVIESKIDEIRTVTCPSCGHNIQLQDDQVRRCLLYYFLILLLINLSLFNSIIFVCFGYEN